MHLSNKANSLPSIVWNKIDTIMHMILQATANQETVTADSLLT